MQNLHNTKIQKNMDTKIQYTKIQQYYQIHNIQKLQKYKQYKKRYTTIQHTKYKCTKNI